MAESKACLQLYKKIRHKKAKPFVLYQAGEGNRTLVFSLGS